MSDEKKPEGQVAKKRGRPPKITQDTLVENEKVDRIEMSTEDTIKMATLEAQWNNIISQYSNKVSPSVMSGAYNTANNMYRNNPWLQSQRVKSLGTRPNGVEENAIRKAIQNPLESEEQLRSTSTALMYQVYLYNVILNLSRDIPQYKHYAFPINTDEITLKSREFKDEAQLVDSAINVLKPDMTFKTLAKAIATEGKIAVVNRVSYKGNKCYFWVPQRLNSDWFKITGFGSNQPFICSFNFALFLNPIYSVDYYPPFFRKIWEEMISAEVVKTDSNNNLFIDPSAKYDRPHSLEIKDEAYIYWVRLDQSDVFCFGTDLSYATAVPDTTGMFLDMGELEKYRWLQLNTLVKSTNAILTAEMEFVKDAKPGANSTMLNPDAAIGFENMFAERISSNVLPFFAPFTNYELFDIPEQPSAQSIILSRLKDILASSGLSGLISTTDKPSVSQTKIAAQLAAEKSRYLTVQFQNYMNIVLNTQFGLKQEWRVKLWCSIFDGDELKRDKEMLLAGVKTLLPKVLSAEGISMVEACAINDYIESLGLQIKYEEPTDQSANPVGRPVLDDGDVENDSTAASKEAGNDVSDTKEFSQGYVIKRQLGANEDVPTVTMCPCCGENELAEGEYLCDDCFNQLVEEKIAKQTAEMTSSKEKSDE